MYIKLGTLCIIIEFWEKEQHKMLHCKYWYLGILKLLAYKKFLPTIVLFVLQIYIAFSLFSFFLLLTLFNTSLSTAVKIKVTSDLCFLPFSSLHRIRGLKKKILKDLRQCVIFVKVECHKKVNDFWVFEAQMPFHLRISHL